MGPGFAVQSKVEMEDARTIILPPGAAAGDARGLQQILDLFVAAAGVPWAELELRAGRSGHRQLVTSGTPSDPSTSIEVEVSCDANVVLKSGGKVTPDRSVIGLFSAALERELGCLCLTAETGLMRSALEATSAAVLLFGPTGSIVYANGPADRLLSMQTEEELAVRGDNGSDDALFGLLCAQVEGMLETSSDESRRSHLALSDGTELTCEVVPVETGAEGLGRFVMVVLREIGLPPDRMVDEFASRHHLSPREREVLRLLVQGLDTTGLADRLGISPHTVRDHLKNVFRKTSSRSRSELLSSITSAGAATR
jgi:DNA-binding CsgD family transcriptional regulator